MEIQSRPQIFVRFKEVSTIENGLRGISLYLMCTPFCIECPIDFYQRVCRLYVRNAQTLPLKAYLSTQPPSFRAFMTRNAHILAQKLKSLLEDNQTQKSVMAEAAVR